MSCWWDDTFTGSNGDPPDPLRWTKAGSPDIQSNTLEVNDNEAVTSNGVFAGDFDVQVDIDLQGSPGNSFRAELQAKIDATHYIGIGLTRYGGGDHWQVAYNTGGGEAYEEDGRSNSWGSLRLVRSGSNITPWYRDGGGGWVSQFARIIGSGDVELRLWIGRWDTFPSVTVQYDDFVVNSGCPEALTSPAPTTVGPTTVAPSTAVPTTGAPTTPSPTSVAPSTPVPTTPAPTTPGPTSLAPTSLPPTTPVPTTSGPTTAAPTWPPTTAAPTTAPPRTVGGCSGYYHKKGVITQYQY